MAYTYTRTITVVPSGESYTWSTPPSWITLSQVGTSNSWEITVNDNSSTSGRTATLTVTHSDGVTTDSILVTQNGVSVVNNPTPVPTATPTPTATVDPTITLSVTKGISGVNWSISSMSIDSNTSSDGVTATGFGLGTSGGGITANVGDLVVINVNMSPNSGREWYSYPSGDSVAADFVEAFGSGDISNVNEVSENSAFQNGSTSMAMYTFSFVVPEVVGPTINIQLEASTQETSNAGTISFGAVGTTTCGTATVDTYSYEDNGVFVVGDSITGALPNSQGARVVTAATGSAATQVGKVFSFMEDEIMGISDCTTPDPTDVVEEGGDSVRNN